jgi:HPr kinase/phosphorylase
VSGADATTLWIHEMRDHDRVTYRLGRQGQELVAEWPSIGRITCRTDGSGARLIPAEPATPTSLAMLQSTATVFVGELCGGLALHGSAVSLEGRGVVVLGESGSGKSTAAATLCARHGGALLADDATLLVERGETLLIEPSEREHHLTQESLAALGKPGLPPSPGLDKAAIPADAAARTPVRLALIAALQFDDACTEADVRTLRGVEAAARLLASLFRFNFPDGPARRNELDRVMSIHERTPVIELRRPRSKPDVAPRIVEALLGDSRGR